MSQTQTFLINETTSSIKIVPYIDGVIDESQSININPGERKSVLNESVFGKTLEPCWGLLIQPYDSVIVVFTSTVNKTTNHLSWRDSSIVCVNCLPFESNRNLTNIESYEKTITKEHKKYLIGYYEYTFTEEDYEFAKE